MSRSDNLADLIHQAENTTQRQAEGRSASRRRPIPLRFIVSALLAGIVAYAGMQISTALSPPAQKEVAHDLEAVIDRAREVIEAARAESGRLPDSLPSASLASVVDYEHDRNGYQLTATIMGVKVTLERSGRKITVLGTTP